jgi:hypothetical protein
MSGMCGIEVRVLGLHVAIALHPWRGQLRCPFRAGCSVILKSLGVAQGLKLRWPFGPKSAATTGRNPGSFEACRDSIDHIDRKVNGQRPEGTAQRRILPRRSTHRKMDTKPFRPDGAAQRSAPGNAWGTGTPQISVLKGQCSTGRPPNARGASPRAAKHPSTQSTRSDRPACGRTNPTALPFQDAV